MLMLTTAASDVDEELLNRCLLLTVNECRELMLEVLLQVSEKSYLTRLHQNAQLLLRTLKVVSPYTDRFTFLSDKISAAAARWAATC